MTSGPQTGKQTVRSGLARVVIVLSAIVFVLAILILISMFLMTPDPRGPFIG